MSQYIKPGVVFFPLDVAAKVSAGCSVQGTSEPVACPMEIPGWEPDVLWLDSNSACTMTPESGLGNSLCYHVPTAQQGIIFDS